MANRPDIEPRRRPPAERARRLQQPSAAARGEARRRPRPRERQEATQEQRMLAVAGVAGLLIIGLIVMISLFTIGGDDESDFTAAVESPPAQRDAGSAAEDEALEDDEVDPLPTVTPSSTPSSLTDAEVEARRAAVATVSNQGFKAVSPSQWRPQNQLRVLVGKAQPASGQRGSKAFFFVGGDYIGTDASTPSEKIFVAKQSDTTITLRYAPYSVDDPPCCPTGDPVNVRFLWSGGKLTPLDPVPSAEERMASAGG